MTTLFLFAHQDDEIGVFHEITRTVRLGKPLRCIYLTNGAWDGVSPGRRNAESITALATLGVRRQDIVFLGERLGINDGQLPNHLEQAWDGLREIAETLAKGTAPVSRLIMQAWEGGHQDHDAVHLVGLALARHLDIVQQSFQFPLYRMPAGRFWLSFAAPLPQNGKVTQSPMGWRQRAAHLMMLRHYRSQTKVMLRIGSHLLWHHLQGGGAKLQPVSLGRVLGRPNSGMMLYEYWQLSTETEFRTQADPFIRQFITDVTRSKGT